MSASESAKQSYILTEQRCSELQQRKNQLAQRSNVGNSKAAAAAAKSLQSCPTLCDPIDGSPPGPAIPGIPQARVLEWVAIAFSLTMYKCSLFYASSPAFVVSYLFSEEPF